MVSSIRDIEIHEEGLLHRAMPVSHYEDAFEITLPDGVRVDSEQATRRILFDQSPRWLDGLMGLRNRLVRFMGIRAPIVDPVKIRKNFSLDREQLGIFRVYGYNPSEALLGDDDWHLDFRVAVTVSESTPQRVAIATRVRFNHVVGKLYFMPVRFFHRLIVRSLLRKARWG